MTLVAKVRSVEEIFRSLDEEIAAFQSWSGLGCQNGCGKCCFKPDITATPLEFLPAAFHVFKAGEAEVLYEKLVASPDGVCTFLDGQRTTGMCSAYKLRGMICRLFGFSARLNKMGQADLITCRIIKTEQNNPYMQAMVLVSKGEKSVPLAAKYYMQLMALDSVLGSTLYPINVAIRKALEHVLHYYAYRSPTDD